MEKTERGGILIIVVVDLSGPLLSFHISMVLESGEMIGYPVGVEGIDTVNGSHLWQ
mgnify:CR=1 FL=1